MTKMFSRFRFSLCSAIIAMVGAGAGLGLVMKWRAAYAMRKEHDQIINELAASHESRGFLAWDFSASNMLSGIPTSMWDKLELYLDKRDVAQRLADQMVEHAEDKDTTILLCNVQLLILEYNFYLARKSTHRNPNGVYRKREFAIALNAGKFERIASMYEDIYIREKLNW